MPNRYAPEFRRRALDLVASGRTVRDAAASLGIAESRLDPWPFRWIGLIRFPLDCCVIVQPTFARPRPVFRASLRDLRGRWCTRGPSGDRFSMSRGVAGRKISRNQVRRACRECGFGAVPATSAARTSREARRVRAAGTRALPLDGAHRGHSDLGAAQRLPTNRTPGGRTPCPGQAGLTTGAPRTAGRARLRLMAAWVNTTLSVPSRDARSPRTPPAEPKICTAVAPDDVRTVRTCATDAGYGPRLGAKSSTSSPLQPSRPGSPLTRA